MSNLPGTTRDAVDIAYRRGSERFVLIDTAGIRPRGKHASSVEVFSVMRSERTIRRAALCVLVVDATMGVTAQDKKIAALMQKAHKPSLVVVNKWDLVKPERRAKATLAELLDETRQRLFFLPYAPILVASALTGENVDRLFSAIRKIRRGAGERVGTGVLNRLLREAFAANPPPMVSNHRLKLFYATQPRSAEQPLATPEFVLFVNDPVVRRDLRALPGSADSRGAAICGPAADAELPSEKRDGAAERTSLAGDRAAEDDSPTRQNSSLGGCSEGARLRALRSNDGRQRL